MQVVKLRIKYTDMMTIKHKFEMTFLTPKQMGAILFALFFFLSAQAKEVSLDRIAAVVNNDVVMLSEVRDIVTRLSRNKSTAPPQEVYKKVLDKLIMEKIQMQRAKDLGIKIDNAALNRAVLSIAKQNKLNLDQFRVALAHEGIDYKKFRESIRDKLYIESLRKRQQGRNAKISEIEVDDLIKDESLQLNQSVQYHIKDILIPAPNGLTVPQFNNKLAQAQQLRKQLIGKPEPRVASLLKKYGASLKDLGWQGSKELNPAKVRALSLLEPGELSNVVRDPAGFHILKLIEQRGGDRKIRKLARVRHILIPASDPKGRLKAILLRNKILAGESFAKLAKDNSADTGSAQNGGELDFTSPDSFVPPFAAAVKSLPLNTLSQPIKTRFGWHILEVLERKTTDTTREALKEKAGSLITDKKKSEEYKNWLQGLRDQAYVEYRI